MIFVAARRHLQKGVHLFTRPLLRSRCGGVQRRGLLCCASLWRSRTVPAIVLPQKLPGPLSNFLVRRNFVCSRHRSKASPKRRSILSQRHDFSIRILHIALALAVKKAQRVHLPHEVRVPETFLKRGIADFRGVQSVTCEDLCGALVAEKSFIKIP